MGKFKSSSESGFALVLSCAARYGADMIDNLVSSAHGRIGIAVLILAAGRGERAGQSSEGPKQYRHLAGKAIIAWTLQAFCKHPLIDKVAVSLHPDDELLFENAIASGFDELGGLEIIRSHGGPTRQISTRLGLESLEKYQPEFVMIHDGVRPFVDHQMIDRIAASLTPNQGVVPALPVSDTLKQSSSDGFVSKTIPRNGLYAAQTPQAFPFKPILEAHRKARTAGLEEFTDDSAIAEWSGTAAKIVTGSVDNLKLTYARDIDLAHQRMTAGDHDLPDVRTGNGYDVHAFTAGDSVTLCGMEIPHDRSLSGHSDADVALHALTDALLATCGAGDIGTHFPPSDAQWKNANSRIFLEHASAIVSENGGRIGNVDITLICEAPKIGPHREPMVEALAEMLNLDPHRISIKATTNEQLGFIGRKEGIAAIATATVVFPGSL